MEPLRISAQTIGVVSGMTVRAVVLDRCAKKMKKKLDLKDTAKKRISIKKYKGVMLWAADVCSRAAFAQPGPVSLISLGRFFSG